MVHEGVPICLGLSGGRIKAIAETRTKLDSGKHLAGGRMEWSEDVGAAAEVAVEANTGIHRIVDADDPEVQAHLETMRRGVRARK